MEMTEKEMLQYLINKVDRIEKILCPDMQLRTQPKTKKQLRDEYKAERVLELRLKRRQQSQTA